MVPHYNLLSASLSTYRVSNKSPCMDNHYDHIPRHCEPTTTSFMSHHLHTPSCTPHHLHTITYTPSPTHYHLHTATYTPSPTHYHLQCRPPTSSHSLARVCESHASQLASAISPRYMRCCERHSNTYLRHTYR